MVRSMLDTIKRGSKKNLGVKSRVTFPIKYTKEFTVYILESKTLVTKGQLISKAIYSVLDYPKKRTKKI